MTERWFIKKWPGGDTDQMIYALSPIHKNPISIARVYGEGIFCKDTTKTDKHAALIAAAPEMLEALEEQITEWHADNANYSRKEPRPLVMARAAVKKAKGEV